MSLRSRRANARALGTAVPGIVDVVPCAAFGAFYFLVSAPWLAFGGAGRMRKRALPAVHG